MLILASSSPTRAMILRNFGINFIQKNSDFDEENLAETDAKDFVYAAAKGKLLSAVKLYGKDDPISPILAADTVVSARGKLLRKAKDIDDAREKLLTQSGAKTSIITCCILLLSDRCVIDISETLYEFDIFDPLDLDRYLLSGDWRGKAGAIMVETFAKKYIKSVSGFESCAMGLTIENLAEYLKGV
ncbi:Maf-like protein [Campylobacterota bacterium]|nr:Maf-like protein [Campylobacterota bacterium]